MKGIWINDKIFVNFSGKKTSLTEEIATRKGAIDFYNLGMYLPNPDTVLKKQGKDITVYNELLTDAHLGGCVTSRKSGVLSLEWSIDRGKAKSRQARLIEDIFKNLDLEHIISEILNGPLFGYQVLEVIWENTGSYILPKSIIGKPQEWFVFGEDNELRLRTKANYNGEPVPERKFLLVQHDATYKNPYGFPSLSRCFWPITFKRGGMKFWVIFSEKYGMPFLVGKHPRGTAQTETDKLADMLENMIQDAVAVIPDDSSVEIKEAGGKGASADIYSKLLEFCKAEVSIALLGQNLTTEVKGGSYAAAESHMRVRKDIIDADKKLVEKALNQLIKWISELNFGASELPLFSMWEEEDVDKDLAERDEKLTASMEKSNLRLSRKYYQKNYGLEDEDIEETQKSGSATEQQFAEGTVPDLRTKRSGVVESGLSPSFEDQQALDDAIDSITPEELQEQMEGVLKPIIDLINDGNSYEEIMEKLIETYPDMDTKAIEDMLSRAIFVSELWGRLNVDK
jgi:phage gp29-like protein